MRFVTEYIFSHAENTPDKAAIVSDGLITDYRRLASMTYGVKKALEELNIKPGDTVLQSAVPSCEYAFTCYGIHLLGAVHVPAENRIPAARLAEIAERVHADLIVSPEDPGCGVAHVTHGELCGLAEKYAAGWDPADKISFPDNSGCGEIIFTTGSTGRSKGVMQSREIVAAYTATINEGVGVSDRTVLLVCTPLNHAGGLHRMHMVLQAGGTLVMMDGLKDLRKYYSLIDAYSVNSLYLPPAAIGILQAFSAKEFAALDGRLDFIFTASAPFSSASKDKMRSMFPNTRLLEAYGSSETGSVCCYDYNSPVVRQGCVGKPYGCVELRFLGEEGRISIHSPMLMLGYLDDPEMTAGVLCDGWFNTTDCGYLDDDGYLIFRGRADDVINIGGMKIAPSEVEAAAIQCAGVRDCGCTFVENAISGSKLRLLVVVKDEKAFSRRAIAEELKKTLEAYKIPPIIESVPAIPRFPNGKIDRKKLKEI